MTPYKGVISGSSYSLGVLKLFTIRGVVLNLTVIELVDLPFYERELVGDFGGE